jgi:hypothetical protein
VGGLLGELTEEGGPAGNYIDDQFVPDKGKVSELFGCEWWAEKKQQKNHSRYDNFETVRYRYWYHTHPHDTGEHIPGEGTPIHSEIPSGEGGDMGVSKDLGLLGILVTKNSIVVFDNEKIRCAFAK